MESPWIPPQQQPPAERPWMGMALLAAVPLLSLVLIRMLWSGSSLWFLAAGILLLAAAAVTYLAQRPQDRAYDQRLGVEANRWPLALGALGVLFLALLLLPNFSGGSGSAPVVQQQPPGSGLGTGQQPTAQQPPAQQPAERPAAGEPAANEPEADEAAAGDGDTYVVKSGDSLWAIAQRFDTSVDAIVEANDLANPSELQVGQELVIPPPETGEEEAVGPAQ